MQALGFSEWELVADERISNSDISAAAQMAKIKAARPDVLYTSTSGTLFSTVMRGMSDAGLNIPVITTTANANLPQLKSLADVLPHEVFFNGSALHLGDQLRDKTIRDQIAAFKDAFNGHHNFSSGDQHGLGSDAVVVIVYDKDKGDFSPASQPGGIPLKR